jgi:hypothetical protein
MKKDEEYWTTTFLTEFLDKKEKDGNKMIEVTDSTLKLKTDYLMYRI